MTTFLAYLTVYGLPIFGFGAIVYLWFKFFPRKRKDPPAPLKNMNVETNTEKLARLLYGSYIRHAQYVFWNHRQHEWDLRKLQEFLTPKTQNRFADRAFNKVFMAVRDIDRDRQDRTNDEIRRFPQRYRDRALQPPWVSVCERDVEMAINISLSPHTVDKLWAMRESLDIPRSCDDQQPRYISV
jgi:hypothetical protein